MHYIFMLNARLYHVSIRLFSWSLRFIANFKVAHPQVLLVTPTLCTDFFSLIQPGSSAYCYTSVPGPADRYIIDGYLYTEEVKKRVLPKSQNPGAPKIQLLTVFLSRLFFFFFSSLLRVLKENYFRGKHICSWKLWDRISWVCPVSYPVLCFWVHLEEHVA